MDSCSAALNVSKGGFVSNGNNRFFGERIRGSLNRNDWSNGIEKSLKFEKRARKIKPGVSFSVLTSNNGIETMVSTFWYIYLMKFGCLSVNLFV